jgi:DNA polymerase
MAACLPFVRAEIDIIRPKVIVALGATAARGLLGLTEPVAKIRGRFLEFQGVPVMVTFHPAYLLHQKSGKAEKRKVWEDMLLVMERLGMPISEKQRRYFAS